MNKLILRCGRYYPPVQSDETDRLGRLENYVVTLSAEAESLFESCERLRREIALRIEALDERLAALSEPEAVSLSEDAMAEPTPDA